jgi:hypothetical protein
LRQPTEIAERQAARLGRRDTAGDVRRDLLLEMKLQLVVDLLVDPAAAGKPTTVCDESLHHLNSSAAG